MDRSDPVTQMSLETSLGDPMYGKVNAANFQPAGLTGIPQIDQIANASAGGGHPSAASMKRFPDPSEFVHSAFQHQPASMPAEFSTLTNGTGIRLPVQAITTNDYSGSVIPQKIEVVQVQIHI